MKPQPVIIIGLLLTGACALLLVSIINLKTKTTSLQYRLASHLNSHDPDLRNIAIGTATNGHDNFAIGNARAHVAEVSDVNESRGVASYHDDDIKYRTIVDSGLNNICIGAYAGAYIFKQYNVILIGDDAQTTNSFEMVIKFESGKEWRMALPTNDPVKLSRFAVPKRN